MPMIGDVVLGALFRIAQDRVCVADLAKSCFVAGFLIVGMITLRQQSIGAADRLRLGIRAHLE